MLLAQIVHIFQDITVDIAKAETEEIIAQRSGIGRRSQAVEVVQSDESIALTRDTVVKFDLGAVQGNDISVTFRETVHGFLPGYLRMVFINGPAVYVLAVHLFRQGVRMVDQDIVVPHVIVAMNPNIQHFILGGVIELDISVLAYLRGKDIPLHIRKVNQIAAEEVFSGYKFGKSRSF